jgi:hypothetical protein
MRPNPPGGGTYPGTRSRARGRWDPKPALGLGMRAFDGVGNDRSGRSRLRVAKGAGFDTSARVREAGQNDVTRDDYGTQAPWWGDIPRHPVAGQGQMGPKPALGLAMRVLDGVGGDRSGRSGGGVAKGSGGFDTRVRVREAGQNDVTPFPSQGREGSEIPSGASAGLPRKMTDPPKPRCRRPKLLQ